MEALLLVLNLPMGFIFGSFMGGEWILLPFITLYFTSPVLDLLVISMFPSFNTLNFFKKYEAKTVDTAIKIYPLIQLALCLYAVNKFKTAAFNDPNFWLTAFSFGVVCGGTGLMIGHELMHRKDKVSRAGTLILTVLASYTHWTIEHIQGHHKNVGTFEDPCTARKNETVYAFFVRSIIGQYVNAFKMNTKRFLTLKLVELAFYLTIFTFFSYQGLVFILVQSVIAALLLENVNYVEHYGLEREKKDGVYEKATVDVSWDTHSILTNVTLLNLGFHADHHTKIDKDFSELEAKSAKVIKYGIPVQLVLSLIPPVWFTIMNPKVENTPIASKVRV